MGNGKGNGKQERGWKWDGKQGREWEIMFFFIRHPFALDYSGNADISIVCPQIATEGLRLDISPGISTHMSKLIKICRNEDPGKRPTFDMIIPILEKMKK